MNNPFQQSVVIFLSFMLSWILMLLPMPGNWHWLRPEWLTLVLIYWMVFSTRGVSVVMVWSVGLVMDVLMEGLLGQYALTLVLLTLLARSFRARVRLFPWWQQMVVVFLLVALSNLILISLQWLIGRPIQTLLYGVSTLSSVVLWPWINKVLRSYERTALG